MSLHGAPVMVSEHLPDGQVLEVATSTGYRVLEAEYGPAGRIIKAVEPTRYTTSMVMNSLTLESLRNGWTLEQARLERAWRTEWYQHPEQAWWEQ